MGSGAAFYVHGDLYRTRMRRNKRNPFKKSIQYFKKQGTKLTFPKVTEIQLNAIREKIKKQHRKDRDRTIVAFLLTFLIAIVVVSIV